MSIYQIQSNLSLPSVWSAFLLLFRCPVMSSSLWPCGLQHARTACPHHLLKFAQVHVHPAISSSDALFSLCPQSFPASRTFPMSWLFVSDDQNTGASASVLPMSIQGWFPWRLTALISLLSKGLSEIFSSTAVFIINSLALCLLHSPTFITICGHWEDHSLDHTDMCQQSNVSAFQHTV